MRVLKDNVELLVGGGRCPLDCPEECAKIWLPLSWIVGLGQYLHRVGAAIQCDNDIMLTEQRENDQFLMNIAKGKNVHMTSIQNAICAPGPPHWQILSNLTGSPYDKKS